MLDNARRAIDAGVITQGPLVMICGDSIGNDVCFDITHDPKTGLIELPFAADDTGGMVQDVTLTFDSNEYDRS